MAKVKAQKLKNMMMNSMMPKGKHMMPDMPPKEMPKKKKGKKK